MVYTIYQVIQPTDKVVMYDKVKVARLVLVGSVWSVAILGLVGQLLGAPARLPLGFTTSLLLFLPLRLGLVYFAFIWKFISYRWGGMVGAGENGRYYASVRRARSVSAVGSIGCAGQSHYFEVNFGGIRGANRGRIMRQ